MSKYSFTKGLGKGAKAWIIFFLAFAVSSVTEGVPHLASLTIGGVLVMLLNYLKISWNLKI